MSPWSRLTGNGRVFRITVATSVSAAPEPGTWLMMMIVGFGIVGGVLRRCQRTGWRGVRASGACLTLREAA